MFSDADIKGLARLIFNSLNKTEAEYIYGGYTSCYGLLCYGYNLKYIPNAEKALSIHVVFPKIYVDKDKFKFYLNDCSI